MRPIENSSLKEISKKKLKEMGNRWRLILQLLFSLTNSVLSSVSHRLCGMIGSEVVCPWQVPGGVLMISEGTCGTIFQKDIK